MLTRCYVVSPECRTADAELIVNRKINVNVLLFIRQPFQMRVFFSTFISFRKIKSVKLRENCQMHWLHALHALLTVVI